MKPRTLFTHIHAEKNSKKISIIIGARQVGKTTLLKQLYTELGGLFLDLDLYSNYEKVATYENCINTLLLYGYKKDQKKFFYLFLDEFQRYSDLSLVLKNIYDHHENIKIFATGSSSISIKNTIQESLSGRKHISYLYPLSFKEFLTFKDRADVAEKLTQLQSIQKGRYDILVPDALPLLQEFMVFGGYPPVALAGSSDEKIQTLNDIFDLYLKKDIVEYLRVEKIRNAKMLLEQLAINHGMQANFSEYGMRVSLDTKTVQNYVEIFQETYLTQTVKPYFSNKNKEISKMPKIYFIDNGVRNFFINNFTDLSKRSDSGVLFEGYCMSEFLKAGILPDELKYYRTKQGAEVDFIIDKVSNSLPIEVKYKKEVRASDIRGIKNFLALYRGERGYVINLGEIDINGPIQKRDCFTLQDIAL